jgi:nitrite reductase (NADH) large subunit
MNKPRLVVVGNGMAGIRTVEELLKLMPGMYDITVFGAEPHPNYNRILLSPVLAGEQQFDEIVLNPLAWYAENGIQLHVGKEVTRIDRVKRKVIAADGTEAPYDRLLLATGSLPIVLPVPGKDLKDVIGYRDMHDTQTMIDTATRKRHAVVIGGGLLGLEAANGLKQRGMQVTVVHLADWLLERQLDPVAGQLLQRSLSERGLEFRLGTSTTELVGNADGDVVAVKFSDGTVTLMRLSKGDKWDLRTAIAYAIAQKSLGGKTAFAVAEEAYALHRSQQQLAFRVYEAGHAYDCHSFGLFRSLVGPDDDRNDLMEHLHPADWRS